MIHFLDVYFRDAKAGTLSWLDDGMLSYSYDRAYLESGSPGRWCMGHGKSEFPSLMLRLCDSELEPDGFRACACQHSIEDGAADGDLRLLCYC